MRIILASHGLLAEGMYDAVKLILGEQKGVDIISGYTTDESIDSQIEKMLCKSNGEEVLVITDIFGGSINNAFIKVLKDYPNMYVVTGMNLGLVIEIMTKKDQIDKNLIREIIESSKKGCFLCNDLIKSTE